MLLISWLIYFEIRGEYVIFIHLRCKGLGQTCQQVDTFLNHNRISIPKNISAFASQPVWQPFKKEVKKQPLMANIIVRVGIVVI